jgi:hypothetical protein
MAPPYLAADPIARSIPKRAAVSRGDLWHIELAMRWMALLCVGVVVLGCDDAPLPEDDGDSGGGAGSGGHAGGHGGDGGGGAAGEGGCVPSLAPDEAPPELLSETGLYADVAAKTIDPRAQPFAPRFELWSDGAEKQRYFYLPDCGERIDASDMDDWSLPVGTRFWKEFVVGGVRVETRLIERVGPGPHDFLFAAYVWNAAETEATRTPEGLVDAKGTGHDVPAEGDCRRCHGSHEKGGGRPSRALGFSALQLAGPALDALADRLSDPPPAIVVPGDATAVAALGYLHANCGHCHNASADRVPQVDLELWLRVGDVAVADTGAYVTAVGVPNTLFDDQHVTARIEPGSPDASAVWYRMNQRGNPGQMPPLASEVVDDAGAATVAAWITSLP